MQRAKSANNFRKWTQPPKETTNDVRADQGRSLRRAGPRLQAPRSAAEDDAEGEHASREDFRDSGKRVLIAIMPGKSRPDDEFARPAPLAIMAEKSRPMMTTSGNHRFCHHAREVSPDDDKTGAACHHGGEVSPEFAKPDGCCHHAREVSPDDDKTGAACHHGGEVSPEFAKPDGCCHHAREVSPDDDKTGAACHHGGEVSPEFAKPDGCCHHAREVSPDDDNLPSWRRSPFRVTQAARRSGKTG
jgi:hypothetical protein